MSGDVLAHYHLDAETRVTDLKRMISRDSGVGKSHDITLTFAGKELPAQSSLAENGMVNDDPVRVLVLLCPIPKEDARNPRLKDVIERNFQRNVLMVNRLLEFR